MILPSTQSRPTQGKIKRTALSEFNNAKRSAGLTAIKLAPGDRLQWVERTKPSDSVVVGNSGGKIIHFDLDDVRPLSRHAGVRAEQWLTPTLTLNPDPYPKPTDSVVVGNSGGKIHFDLDDVRPLGRTAMVRAEQRSRSGGARLVGVWASWVPAHISRAAQVHSGSLG
jgi:DNA gyrase/topoisomerase IV subunit A